MLGRWKEMGELNRFFAAIDIVRAPLLGVSPAAHSWEIVLLVTILGSICSFAMFARLRARIAYWIIVSRICWIRFILTCLPRECGGRALDAGQHVVGCLGPAEGFGSAWWCEIGNQAEHPSLEGAFSQWREEPLTWLIQEADVGVKCTCRHGRLANAPSPGTTDRTRP